MSYRVIRAREHETRARRLATQTVYTGPSRLIPDQGLLHLATGAIFVPSISAAILPPTDLYFGWCGRW